MSFELEAIYENGTFSNSIDHCRWWSTSESRSWCRNRHSDAKPAKTKDWWKALQEIRADQKRRGLRWNCDGI